MLHYFLYGFMRLQLAYSLKRSPFHTFFFLSPFMWHFESKTTMFMNSSNYYDRLCTQCSGAGRVPWTESDSISTTLSLIKARHPFQLPSFNLFGWLFYQRHTFFVHTFPLGMIIFFWQASGGANTRKFIFVMLVVQHKNHETYVIMPSQRFTNSEAFLLGACF